MTDDGDMLRLLTACDLAKAKVILVGDHRQLGPVGPGGALRALLNRHHGIVHVLAENVRQDDPHEREALRQLRGGKVADAVAWYADHDRIRIAPDAHEALQATVDAWYADVCAGKDAAMYAWRRTNVDALNRLARDRFAPTAASPAPNSSLPAAATTAVGDRIVTLAPAADGQVVTSERGEVVSVDARPRRPLIVRMDDGRFERLEGDELAKDRLAYGYAVTVHRSQGSTVDVAHRYEDGGGRELAYVSMSRGRECNTVHVVADNLDQAAEDLTRDWSVDHRARWAIDSGTPATEPLAVEHDDQAPAGMRAALRHARLQAERDAVAAAIPRRPEPRAGQGRPATRRAPPGPHRPPHRPGTVRAQRPKATAARRYIDARQQAHRRPAPRRDVRQLAGPPPLAQGGHPMGRRGVRRRSRTTSPPSGPR